MQEQHFLCYGPEELQSILKRLRLANLRVNIEEYLSICSQANLTPRQTISFLLGKEIEHRIANGIKIKTDMARFPMPATIDNFDFAQSSANQAQFLELSECHWIGLNQNILFYGEPGLGKTHLAIALGRQAIMRGYSTLFVSANDLFVTLAKANHEGTLQEKLTSLSRYRLLIVDELGYPLTNNENWAALFYTLVAKRHERGSTIITTNRPVRDWPMFLSGDVACTKASIDRFMQHAIHIKLEGESYRLKNFKLQQLAVGEKEVSMEVGL